MNPFEKGTFCPLCRTWYAAKWFPVGTQCGDVSQGQIDPCPARLVAYNPARHPYQRGPFGMRAGVERKAMARIRTEFFKSGDAMAIRTNATTEEEFLGSVAEGLSMMIDGERFQGDWEFQLRFWLQHVVDIASKLRGYKAEVEVQQVITAGFIAPAETDRVQVVGDSIPPTAVVR